MAKVVLDVPGIWADHHVLKARDALLQLDGVEEVFASSGWKQVLVTYDAPKLQPEELERALEEAGYPIGAGGPEILVQPNKMQRDPQWEVLGARTTETNDVDLDMSGEFRRY